MRRLILCLAALLCACAHVSSTRFEPGQVWTLADATESEARLVIGAVQRRHGRTVIHASVVNLSAPPRAAEALERMHLFFSPHEPQGEPLTRFMLGGMSGETEEWYAGTIELDVSPDAPNGAVVIPHVALYESELRAAVSELVGADHPPVEFFGNSYELWRQGEASWPNLHDRELNRPLLRSIATAEAALRSQLSAFLVPVPPADPGPDETAVRDTEYDEHCLNRATVIVNQLNQDIGTTLLTRSEAWGLVWRADRQGPGQTGATVDRVICWLMDGDEESHLAFAWSVSPLRRLEDGEFN